MKTLDQIAIEHQTDKASQFTRTYAKPHDYCRHLERFFDPVRYKAIKILEIGIGGGESARTWLEYFPKALVHGVDIVHDTNPYNTPFSTEVPRYVFNCGDQTSEVFWKCFVADYGNEWDIIIDDGSHISSDIITTFGFLWPSVKPGGIYEIEDLNVAADAKAWLLAFVGNIHAGAGDVDAIHFSKELAIMRKRE
jgi:hypothetical protein